MLLLYKTSHTLPKFLSIMGFLFNTLTFTCLYYISEISDTYYYILDIHFRYKPVVLLYKALNMTPNTFYRDFFQETADSFFFLTLFQFFDRQCF